MKYYTITVNGSTYEVSVEEASAFAVNNAPVAAAPVAAPKPVAAPAAVKAPAPVAKPAAAPATKAVGSVKVNSPMPGKILAVKADVGQVVKRGEVILILEAMKMENEIVAPQEGTLASINVAVSQTVEAGDLLFTFI